MYDLINRCYEEGCRDYYAGGAMGFDRMAGAAVLEYKRTHPDVKLHLILPCKDQYARWNHFERDAYRRQLAQADTITYIADAYVDGCMRMRNQALVDRAKVCIAYAVESHGGTVQTMRMASEKGLRVYNIGNNLS
jgi:uncharacterized phage-like protein YoqJ